MFTVSCCSTVDLMPERLRERDIRYLPFSYMLNGREYTDDMWQSRSAASFYADMAAGATPQTALISPEGYRAYFEPMLAAGKDVLHIALSGGMSGTCRTAELAAEELRERYPDRRLYVVDSLGASSGTGMLAEAVADLRDAGLTIDEALAWVEENKRKLHYWFLSTDLTYYVRGGRLTRAAGWIGTVLNICPVMWVDGAGRIVPRQKARGKEHARMELVRKMEQYARGGTAYAQRCYVCHSAARVEAEMLAQQIRARFPQIAGEIELYDIGPTIGCHSGAGTLAVFFWSDTARD